MSNREHFFGLEFVLENFTVNESYYMIHESLHTFLEPPFLAPPTVFSVTAPAAFFSALVTVLVRLCWARLEYMVEREYLGMPPA